MENHLKSALFIDFDNIFIRLNDQDPELAEKFATQPQRWLSWLEKYALPQGCEEQRRAVLIRKCYLNPQTFHDFRPHFITSAFGVTDCPPLTKQGKTSADIHMVLDILDTMNRDTHFDEFIIFSGDADFTPVLIKLRENARLTTVLHVGPTSPAYKAASSMLISEDQFIEEALDYRDIPESIQDHASALNLKEQVRQFILETVGGSGSPIVMATLAAKIRQRFTRCLPCDSWFGAEKFRDFLHALDLGGVQISSVIPGYVFDPERHEQPREASPNTDFEQGHPELFQFARLVHQVTDVPLLTPSQYRELFSAISDEVTRNGFQLTTTSKNVRDYLVERDLPVSRQHVNFVLIGIGRSGYMYRKDGSDTPLELSKAFAQNVKNLCVAAQLSLDEKRINKLFEWVITADEEGLADEQ